MGQMQDYARQLGHGSVTANPIHSEICLSCGRDAMQREPHKPDCPNKPPTNPLQRRYNELCEEIAKRKAMLHRTGKQHGPGSWDATVTRLTGEAKRIERKMNALARLKS